jgi:GNAT superfamily N-acetyltransferase
VRVRPAQADDFDVVVALLEELGRARVTDETREDVRAVYERHLEAGHAHHLVAEDDGQVIAFCSLHFRERLNHPTPDAWIPDLIVTESARRRGAARALLREAEGVARERGCWQLTLESGYTRRLAHRLYAAEGMTDAGKYFLKELSPS